MNPSPSPILAQLALMDSCPLTCEFERSAWEGSFDDCETLNRNRRLMLAVLDVEMRGRMIIPEHGDDDPIER